MNVSITECIKEATAGSFDEPFHKFLGLEERMVNGERIYFMAFRDEHVGNPLIGTFHGGILASFGEVVAARYLAQHCGDAALPTCSTMTFDYMRPAFAGKLQAIPTMIRVGRRIATVSVELRVESKVVCIGRFIFTVDRKGLDIKT
ncbi:MAG: PaaI family thioesterase [Gammaproteobacteria bacterium]|nr:PaaI family thioesterase [Gammaproteobacteria bacterium]